MGNTAGGLPYPEPTAPVRDGAGNIKSLADKLEARGHGQRIEHRSVYATMNAAGGFGISWARPFAAAPEVAWILGNAASGIVPVAGMLASGITASGASGVACNAMTGNALTDAWINYIAIGPDPGL
jgi:hypothetical protein